MPLPIVEGSQVNTEVGAAKIDPSAFRRAALTKGEMFAGAGNEAAQLLASVGDKMQQVANTKHVIDADIQIKKFNQQQEEALSKNPNPTTWSKNYNNNFTSFRDQLMSNPQYGPDIRNHITGMLDQSQANTDINIRTAANKRQISDTRASIIAGSELDIQNAQPEEAMKKYTAGLHSGVYDQAEYDMLVQQLPKKINVAEVENGLTKDPISTYQALIEKDKNGNFVNYKSIEGKQRDAISNTARIRAVKEQSDNFITMMQDDYDPSIGGVSEEVVNEKMNSNLISRKAGENYLNAFKKAAEATSKKELEQVARDNTQQLQHVEALAANPLGWRDSKPEDMRDMLLNEASSITDKVKQEKAIAYVQRQYQSVLKQGRTEEKPWQADILARMTEDRERNSLTLPMVHKLDDSEEPTSEFESLAGGLKALRTMSDEDLQKRFGKGAKRADLLQAEGAYFDGLRNKMREWFHDPNNQNKTPEEGELYRKQLEAPVVYNIAKKSLMRKMPSKGAIIKQDGVTYRFDGQNYVEVKTD